MGQNHGASMVCLPEDSNCLFLTVTLPLSKRVFCGSRDVFFGGVRWAFLESLEANNCPASFLNLASYANYMS